MLSLGGIPTFIPEKRLLRGLRRLRFEKEEIGIACGIAPYKDKVPYIFYLHDNSSEYPHDPIGIISILEYTGKFLWLKVTKYALGIGFRLNHDGTVHIPCPETVVKGQELLYKFDKESTIYF